MFFISLFFQVYNAHAAKNISRSELEKKISTLDSRLDKMQKYIFNSQGKNMRLQNNEMRVNDIVEQIVILRTDQLELRQELAKLDKEMQALFDNLNASIKDLSSKIDLSSYNKKIIDIIINDFEHDKSLVKESRQEFVDSKQLELEEKSYNNIIKLLKDKEFEQGKLALKKFLIAHPSSSLNSNVYFYIGDIYFKDLEYINAAVNFYKGYQLDPQGPRSGSNIMMLLKSFYQMGRLSDTCKLCQYIERNHNSLPSLMKRELHSIKNATKCNLN